MRHPLFTASLLLAVASHAPAQDLPHFDDLKLQLHCYATQSFLYTIRNNRGSTNSSDGRPAFTEAACYGLNPFLYAKLEQLHGRHRTVDLRRRRQPQP